VDEEPMTGNTVWTVGHGTRAIEDFVAILHDAGVDLVVDVRRFPGSRRSPQFARDALADALAASGIEYLWLGEELGGRRRGSGGPSRWRNAAFAAYEEHMASDAFRAGLQRVEAAAISGRSAVLLCAETVWWRCHRRLIADALVRDGFAVVHLLGQGRSQPHPATERAAPNLSR
jgi:uncharacterized protein (DUF488 family)